MHWDVADCSAVCLWMKRDRRGAVKKAYYKLSLPYHPQIAGKKLKAARKFQALGKIYSVLSDVNKRRLYNREGSWMSIRRLCWFLIGLDYWSIYFPGILNFGPTQPFISFWSDNIGGWVWVFWEVKWAQVIELPRTDTNAYLLYSEWQLWFIIPAVYCV